MRPKIAFLLLLALLTGFLAGCWSREELNELAIVLAAGVDWTADGRVLLTAQIARTGAFASGGEGGGGKEPASWVVSAEGRTLEEAERYLAMRVPRDIYWGHRIVLVFGEAMAQKGIGLATNFWQRGRQPEVIMQVMVTQGEARDVIQTSSELAKTSGQAVQFLTQRRTGYRFQLNVLAETLASR